MNFQYKKHLRQFSRTEVLLRVWTLLPKTRVMKWVLIFILSYCSYSRADEVSIRLDIDGSLKQVPVMDQDSKAFCYAYATAQLVDSYRFGHGDKRTNHITSPVMMAVEGSKIDIKQPGSTRTDPDYMFPWNAIEAVKKNGSCNHLKVKDNYKDRNLAGYIGTLKDYHSQIEATAKLSWSWKKVKDTYNVVQACRNFVQTQTGVNPGLVGVYSALTQSNPVEVLGAFYKEQCEANTINVSLPDYQVFYKAGFDRSKGTSTEKFAEKIQAVLKDKKQPVGIVYCANILSQPNYSGAVGGRLSGDCGYHVSLVAGSRTNQGKKEFLIRNSEGVSCSAFSPPRACDRGQIWITEEELENNATHIYYFN